MSTLLPPSELIGSLPAEEFVVISTDDDPAAGVEVIVDVPGRATWELIAVRVDLVTDATAPVRAPALVIDNGSTEVARIPAGATVAASLTSRITWVAGGGSGIAIGTVNMGPLPVPPLGLPGGWRVRTATDNLAAGDNYGRPQVLVRERPLRGELADVAYRLDRLIDRLGELTTLEGEGG